MAGTVTIKAMDEELTNEVISSTRQTHSHMYTAYRYKYGHNIIIQLHNQSLHNMGIVKTDVELKEKVAL